MNPSQLFYICYTLVFVPLMHYSIKDQVGITMACLSVLPWFFLFLFSHLPFPILWQDEGMGRNAKLEMMCPRFPEPLPLEHPIPSLKEALEKVRGAIYCEQM